MLSSISSIQGELNRSIVPQQAIDFKKESSTAQSVTDGTEKPSELSPQELQKLQALKARDQEVRTHEQAHLSAAGSIALGGPNFTFAIGPDGRKYAIGGDVQVDVSAVPDDPEATLKKAEQIRRAAMAPASPSGQDQRVAANAAAMASKAQLELLKQTQQLDHSEAPEQQNGVGTLVNASA